MFAYIIMYMYDICRQGDGEEDNDASCDEDGFSSSVVMVPTEDGGTMAVQVEYLDDDLYDKIFGAPDLQMAGSLPDLPNNQVRPRSWREHWAYGERRKSLTYCQTCLMKTPSEMIRRRIL